jgi:HPt (histidine-containing phosphotransfer) domain-containing protein
MYLGGRVSDASAAAKEKTAALLKAMWEKNLPLLRERVAVLSAAAEASARGELSEELRVEAHAVAHKLAGSLGMFGYPEGTRVARELEILLTETVLKAALFQALTEELKILLPL